MPLPPPGSRLILASENLLEYWGTRTEDGSRITVEWGEPDENGWYAPVFTKHQYEPPEDEILFMTSMGRLYDAIHHAYRDEGTSREILRHLMRNLVIPTEDEV